MSPSAATRATVRSLSREDPVWRAAMAAPLDTTPDTDEELAAIEAVKRSGFHSVPSEVVAAELAKRSDP